MRLILYSWHANNEQVLADNLRKLGFEVVWFRKECRHYTRDMELAMEMIQYIHAQATEAVISFNYFPIISMICQTCGIPYYAWVYDCPHFTLYAKQINDACNHIGIFDREMVRQLEGYGVRTAYHVPLSADSAYFEDVIARASHAEREKYRCDVSFVGSLYTDEHNYYELLFSGGGSVSSVGSTSQADQTGEVNRLEQADQTGETNRLEQADQMAGTNRMNQTEGANRINHESSSPATGSGMADAIMRQCFSYEEDYLRLAVESGGIDLTRIQESMEQQGLMLGEDYFAKPEDILLAAVLEKKVTVEERRQLLTALATLAATAEEIRIASSADASEVKQAVALRDNQGNLINNLDFRLYTGSTTKGLPTLNACNHGTVDYHTQMPLVFAGSRINLNISLRSIHSGIPLRVLDIMACGGFVLSNRQPEITEYFEEGVEIVTFGSMEECIDKVHYYLSHEEERRQIAEAGYRKVKNEFSYEAGLARLFGV